MAACSYDIIVVGGGPAGSSAALRAARLGARVLVLDKRRMPRPKLCGGWVSQRAIDLLEVSLPASLSSRPFLRAALSFRNASQQYEPNERLGVFVDRAEFDHYLLTEALEAGADCRVDTVTAIGDDGSGFSVTGDHQSYRASGVILASGSNSSILNCLRAPDKPGESAIALEQRLPPAYADRWNLRPGDAWLAFGVVAYGYGWALHHGSHLLIGVGAMRSRCENITQVFADLWTQWRLPEALFAPRGHLIPLGGYRRRLGRGRLLSAGDAAGMVDPFDGEGIAAAIRSGQLAAQSLISGSGQTASRAYQTSCDHELVSELRMARRVAEMFHRLPEHIVRPFCSDPRLAADYHDVIRQRLSYAGFMRRLVKRRLFRGVRSSTAITSSLSPADSDGL